MPVYIGTYVTKSFTLKDATTGLAIDITGYQFKAEVRQNLTDTAPLATMTTANGDFAVTNAAAGQFAWYMTPANTALFLAGRLLYDVVRTDLAAGPVYLFGGSFVAKEPVTR